MANNVNIRHYLNHARRNCANFTHNPARGTESTIAAGIVDEAAIENLRNFAITSVQNVLAWNITFAAYTFYLPSDSAQCLRVR